MSRSRITRSNLSNLTDDQIELLVNQPEEDAIEFEIDQSDIENYSDNEDQTQLQPEDIDIEEQLENNDESENDTIDRLEVTARVRRKFTIEEIQDEDLYNYVPIPEIEKQTQGVLEKKQRNIDEVLVKYSNQQQHNVRGRQAAANLPADSGAKLRVPKERCDTELKSFHQVNK